MFSFIKNIFPLMVILYAASGCKLQAINTVMPHSEPSPAPKVISVQDYHVSQQIALINDGPGQPQKQNIWIALIQSRTPYQEVLTQKIMPDDFVLVIDEYGNTYAEFDFSEHPVGASRVIQINYTVRVNELEYDLSNCQGELLKDFIQPELNIESANTQIVTLADQLSRSKETSCEQVRAFYDHIGNTLVYSPNNGDWGAQATLGLMGADCTEYTDLLIALSRAKEIPARYYEGLLYLPNESEALARVEHAWADVYLPGAGWVSIDPTLGRSSIYRDHYFAHHTSNHIIVTTGVNPSTLRGGNYWTHIYWPGTSTKIRVEADDWVIEPAENR